jgi:hypothetical protein
MKTILSLVLLCMTLLVSGCGYDSATECQIKESQKCKTDLCVQVANRACSGSNWKNM